MHGDNGDAEEFALYGGLDIKPGDIGDGNVSQGAVFMAFSSVKMVERGVIVKRSEHFASFHSDGNVGVMQLEDLSSEDEPMAEDGAEGGLLVQ